LRWPDLARRFQDTPEQHKEEVQGLPDLLEGLSIDWWTLLKNEWVDTEAFGL